MRPAINDLAEFVIQEGKLLKLSQLQSFQAESMQYAAGNYAKKSNRKSLYSLCIGPDGFLRPTECNQHLSTTAFETPQSP